MKNTHCPALGGKPEVTLKTIGIYTSPGQAPPFEKGGDRITIRCKESCGRLGVRFD